MKKRLLQILIVLVVLVIVAVGVGFFFLGSIVKHGVESVGPKVTKVPVKLDSATLSVFSGNGELKGLLVANPEGYKTPSAIKVGTVNIVVEPRSVFSDKVVARSIKLVGPEITLEGDLTGNNLMKLLNNVRGTSNTETKTPGPKDPGGSKNIQVDDFLLSGGRLNLQTSLLGGQAASLAIPEIHLTALGQGPRGITAAELTELVLKEILEKATQVATAQLSGKVSDVIKDGASKQVEKLGEGLGGLLKKK